MELTMAKTYLIKPTLEDLSAVLSVEKTAWPDIGEGMVAEKEKFATRLKLNLMYLLIYEDKPAGIISYQDAAFTNAGKIKKILDGYKEYGGFLDWSHVCTTYGLPKDWYAATNNGHILKGHSSTHDPSSDVSFLIGVGVDSALKGNGLVNKLINHTLQEAQAKGKAYVIGYGRLPQLHEVEESMGGIPTITDAEQHLVKKKPGTSLPYDYGARFHVANGAQAVAVIPHAMDDPESCHYGFLAVYDLREICQEPSVKDW